MFEIWFKHNNHLTNKIYKADCAEIARLKFYNDHPGYKIISVMLAL